MLVRVGRLPRVTDSGATPGSTTKPKRTFTLPAMLCYTININAFTRTCAFGVPLLLLVLRFDASSVHTRDGLTLKYSLPVEAQLAAITEAENVMNTMKIRSPLWGQRMKNYNNIDTTNKL
jgi:hypothetical protein